MLFARYSGVTGVFCLWVVCMLFASYFRLVIIFSVLSKVEGSKLWNVCTIDRNDNVEGVLVVSLK